MGTPIEDDPETFMMFVEESVDALTRIERNVLDAEQGRRSPTMMETLFRDMHTIKGTSGFLALDRITALAHAAEDLMGAIREGTLVETAAHYAMLLQVADGLRGMIEHTRLHGDEGPIDHAPLVARLRAAIPPEAPEVPVVGRLGEMLVARGVASVEDIQQAVRDQEASRAGNAEKKRLGEILVEKGVATPEEIAEAVEAQAAVRAEAVRPDVSDGTVRVSVQVLDRLMNLMGELVLARNQMVQLARANREGAVGGAAATQRLGLVTSELQEQVMKTRMQPVGRVFEKIPRIVRDLQASLGKQVEVKLEGSATELDRVLIEAIRDPVTHMVRNCVDHGIEPPAERLAAGKPATGTMHVRAWHEGGMVCVEIEDDGRGMDPGRLRAHAVKRGVISAADAERLSDREALELVFRPGFSTAEKVSNISGRGVGMDVVRESVTRAGGQVELSSQVGRGTTIRIKMPLTLAIIPALIVRAAGQRFCIPQVSLIELVYLDEEQSQAQITRVRDAEIYRLRGEMLPLVRLSDVMGAPRPTAPRDVSIVVVAAGEQRYGLVVDEILDTEEIVVKPMHPRLKKLACYTGATVLGDGGVALIVEAGGVAAMAGIRVSSRDRSAERTATAAEVAPGHRLLVVQAGAGAPCAVPLGLVSRLEQIATRSIEQVGGREVVQYRNTIMPLVRPEHAAPIGAAPVDREEQQVVVFDFGKPVGMLVNAIVDVVEAAVADVHPSDVTPGATGTAVIFGRTTLMLDVPAILAATGASR